INMVNDMLTISRIEGDRFDLNQDKVNLNNIVEQTYLILSPLATNKNFEFKKRLAKKAVFVVGDAAKITEVVQNIVGNALKFTRQGQIILSCYQENDQAFISVKDTGPGIAPEDFSKLFQKFCRLENSYVKIRETGTGLGLYIARQIMRKHHGDIIAESTFGKGSTFTLVFPLVAN
ncbi:MAG: HAMP domain-containing histidine kinase, partial [Candidatus Moranbacteria bacterium]|nr:HAMP domain-containing histidine kinase [Candidatus Moranbacteria bacterium]